MPTRTKWIAGLLVLGLIAVALAFLHLQTGSALRDAEVAVAAGESVPFQEIGRSGASSGLFEPYASAPEFVGAAGHDGRLVLAGADQLRVLGQDGAADSVHRSGETLPPARITAIAEGRAMRGPGRVLFVGTSGEGLLILTRFEPLTFDQVRADEVRYRDITAVLPLGDGRVALGTRRAGVLVYDGAKLAPLHKDLAGQAVTALAGDAAELWIGTMAGGAYRLRGAAIEHLSGDEGLEDPHVSAILLEGESAFIATPMGVSEWVDGRWRRAVAEGLFATAMRRKGRELLLGTLDQGAYSVALDAVRRPGRATLRPIDAVPGDANIRAFVQTADATAAISPAGLHVLSGEPRTADASAASDSLAHTNVSALAFDSAGRIWVGYFDRGLDILASDGRRERHIEDDTVFCVNRIASDARRGRMYVGTANGLAVYDSAANRLDILRREDGLLADHVTDVLPSAQKLTVATPAGLSFVDDSGARGLYAFHGLVNNHVYAVAESGGELLAATLGGLSLLAGESVRSSFTTANSNLRHNWITAAVADGGEWYLGTYGGGVARLTEGGEIVPFPDIHGQLEVNPLAIAAAEGRVFAGSLGRGLWVYAAATDRWTQITAGLPSTNVTALATRDGWLWVATDNGLVRVEISRLPS